MLLAQPNQTMRFALAALMSIALAPTTTAAPRSFDCMLNHVETMAGQNFDVAAESRSVSLTLDEESQTITLYQNGAGQALNHVTITEIAINGYTDDTRVGIQVSSGDVVLQSYDDNITKAEFGICRQIQKKVP